ncbi:GTP-binding protein, partial [Patescibacteria group bacterium]|nr:GTP-binding protein [Patescibacteria group bacterium]
MEKRKKNSKDEALKSHKFYPPVVVVLGHVDHGKTTLLDAIRKTNVAQKEHGGITQKIGASTVEILHEGIKRKITFVDTPGHEAFSKMRSRGAQVADIGVLVVSATDGVMPQTKESIKLLLDAKIPYVIALTKSDLPEKNPEKVKQQLLKNGIMLERLGGNVPVIEVSAKVIFLFIPSCKISLRPKELLELILLTLEIEKQPDVLDKNEKGEFRAIVIESKLDLRAGPKATIVVKNGKISVKDELLCEGIEGKTRAFINNRGEHLISATIGDAVEILGFEKIPPVGGIVLKKSETSIKKVENLPLKPFVRKEIEEFPLSVIIGADTQGSLEAIVNSLPKNINIISQKTGEITPADVLLAKSVNAIILGFNLKLKNDVLRFAVLEKVLLKNYAIIYELIDEIKDALAGKELSLEEKIFGKAKILASFPFEKTQVLGVIVLEGRIAKGDKVRLLFFGGLPVLP